MKRTCLDELGQGWLVRLICDDFEDDALSSGDKRNRTAFPNDEMDEDVVMDQFEEQVDSAFAGSVGRLSNSRPSSSRSKSAQQVEMRLAALRDAEMNPARRARKDDIAVQEQGLDFIRNLICGANHNGVTDTQEMIEHLFNVLGQDQVFQILASKLTPRVLDRHNKRSSSSEATRVIPPQPEIVNSVAMILVHMAASAPYHRQLVISQTELLKLLVPQFNNPSIDVRATLVNMVANLTYMDDAADSPLCGARVNELINLGFLAKLEQLEQDPELNIREKAKAAAWQMKHKY